MARVRATTANRSPHAAHRSSENQYGRIIVHALGSIRRRAGLAGVLEGGGGVLLTSPPHSLETPEDKIHSEGSRNNSTGHRGADGHTSFESQNVFGGCVFARTRVAGAPPHGPRADGRGVRERLAHAAGAGAGHQGPRASA